MYRRFTRASARRVAAGLLSESQRRRVRAVLTHARAAAAAALNGEHLRAAPPIAASWETLREGVATYSRAPEQNLKHALLTHVIRDGKCAAAAEDPHFAAVAGDSDLYWSLRGASAYVHSTPLIAADAFARALERRQDALNFYLLGRCWSVGVLDHVRAIEVLRRGLDAFPGDARLLTLLAATHYRAGDTAAANQTLKRGRATIKALFHDASVAAAAAAREVAIAAESRVAGSPEQTAKGYGEDAVRPYWENLWFHMTTATSHQHGWASLSWVTKAKLAETLRRFPEIRRVVNLGVFCAHPDYQLALDFPDVDFVGVDLQQTVQDLNRRAFPAPNLRFLTGDITELLPQLSQESRAPTLMFHARTTNLLFPDLISRIYRAAAGSGVEYVALWENDSLSRSTLRFYDLDDFPEVPVAYSHAQWLHNYKRLFSAAGYEVTIHERLPSTTVLIEDLGGDVDGHAFMVARLV